VLVWECRESGRKQNSQNSIVCELATTRLRGRPRNRRQDEVREDGRIVGGEEWQEEVYNREEWKKLLRMARNRHILHMSMEQMKAPSHLNAHVLPLILSRDSKAAQTEHPFWTLFEGQGRGEGNIWRGRTTVINKNK
jgi:hypothetical protein